jgi:hypothetical protein
MHLSRNKLKTAGYIIKRLRDNGYIVIKIFAFFSKTDPRRWTILINPGGESVFMTCYSNLEGISETTFELNDGGCHIPKNFHIKTDSLEVIIEYLLSRGISNSEYYPGKNKFIKARLNTSDEQQEQKAEEAQQKVAQYKSDCA